MFTLFLRDRLEILHTCSTCPCRGLTSGVAFVFVSSPKTFGLRWSNFSEKSHLTKNQAKKKKKGEKSDVFAKGTYIEDGCKISAKFHVSESKKRRGHSPGNKLGGFNVYVMEFELHHEGCISSNEAF